MANVCVCGEYFHVDESGELCMIPGSMGLREHLVYLDVGTYQFRPEDYPWLARLRVRVQAAGGGSAGAEAGSGECVARAGGAGGAYAESILDVEQLGAVETIVVGEGGVPGVGNEDGGVGGASSFGGLVSAPGGAGSLAAMEPGDSLMFGGGTTGPTAGVGDYSQGGGAGMGAIRLSSTQGLAGQGGASMLGHGGVGRTSRGAGTPARGRGAGAGGALSRNSDTVFEGFRGGHGQVLLELYG